MGYIKQILKSYYYPLKELVQIEFARMQYMYIYTLTMSKHLQEHKLNYTPTAGTAADVAFPLTLAAP